MITNDIMVVRLLDRQEKLNLYNEAVAFYELAECGRINIPERKNVESYIPYIVNMTFATELFLKLLLIESGKTIDAVVKLGHSLSNLYKELTVEQQEIIYKLFKQPKVYSISNELARADTAFIRWRYLVLDKANGKIEPPWPVHPFSEEPKALSGKQIKDTARGPNAYPIFFFKELNEVLCSMCRVNLGIAL